MKLVVYGKPACVQCTQTTRAFERAGVQFDYIDLTKDEAAMAMVLSLGYSSAPVVVHGDDHWAGFRPEKISSAVAQHAA